MKKIILLLSLGMAIFHPASSMAQSGPVSGLTPTAPQSSDNVYISRCAGNSSCNFKTTIGQIWAGSGGTPAGTSGQLQYNNAGAFGAVPVGTSGLPLVSTGTTTVPAYAINGIAGGGTASSTAQGALDNFFTAPIGTAAPVLAPCTGADENNIRFGALPEAQTNKVPVILPAGCVTFNQMQMPANSSQSFMMFGGQPNDKNTNANTLPYLTMNNAGIAANAAGGAGMDLNGQLFTTFNGVNIFGTGDLSQAATIMYSSRPNSTGGATAANTITMTNSAMGGMNGIIGTPVDATLNPVKVGTPMNASISSGGTGYTASLCAYNIPMVGGSGTGGIFTQLCSDNTGSIIATGNSGGAAGVGGGQNYVLNDVVNIGTTSVFGAGSGFGYTITNVAKHATSTAANSLIRLAQDQFSQFGSAIALNISDAQYYATQFSGGYSAIKFIFGGGGNNIELSRIESVQQGIDIGNNSSCGNGSSIIGGITFDHNQYYFPGTVGFDYRIGCGNAFAVGPIAFSRDQWGTSPTAIIGGNGTVLGLDAFAHVWAGKNDAASNSNIIYGWDLRGSTDNYLRLEGINMSSEIIAPINYANEIPAQMEADILGPTGYWATQGRNVGIGTNIPRVGFDAANTPNATLPTIVSLGTSNTQLTVQNNTIASIGTTGVTAYYKFDDASGSTVVDSIAAANGIWNGMLGSQWGTGIVNGDGVFNGTDNYVVTTYSGITGTAARTINIWFKTTTSAPGGAITNTLQPNLGSNNSSALVYYGTFATNQAFQISVSDKYGSGYPANGLTLDIGGAAVTYNSPINMYDGNWHMATVAMPTSGHLNTTKLYIDSMPMTNVVYSLNTSNAINTGTTTKVSFGGTAAIAANYKGQIDEAGFWNSQLNQSQIAFLYNLGRANQYPFTDETQTANIQQWQDGTGAVLAEVNAVGSIGIGTTMPMATLQVGSATSIGTQVILQNSSGACSLNPGASTLTTTCSSDIALKSDIIDSPSSLDWLRDIKIRDFTVKATGERMQGVVAQEMLSTHSDMVHIAPNGLYAVDQPNPWILVKAIQELNDKIDELLVALGGTIALGAGGIAIRRKLSGNNDKPTETTT